ncbi:MAG: hypothetical protein KDI44_17755 [Thiothrix sp.]|nr:hypothetical protein [Thiothrix sp.]HPQ96346.1 hypothetical protein [Thiolinea sp.]
MKEKHLTRLMYLLIVVGLGVSATGVGLVLFTDIETALGIRGIATVAGLIAGGLFVSVPAKIYLTLQLMKYNDEKLRAQRERGEL